VGSAAFKKDLNNIRILCDRLGNPQQHFKCIHIGGTNGKGSVSHMLAAVLASAGYKTGLYTSPHLYDFRERIKIDGALVDETFVIDFVRRIQPVIDEIEPSFFEITVAMAFQYFAQEGVDVAVIEVGLGGRLDSTNIITPVLSVITNIGWDHMNMLGNTLEEIAFEKAGIIKEATPVIVGEKDPVTSGVFSDVSTLLKAPLTFAEDKFKVTTYTLGTGKLNVSVLDLKTKETNDLSLGLTGIYQLKNIITVLAAIKTLQELSFNIPTVAIKDGLKEVKNLTGLSGRWEIILQQPQVVLEVAHNINGIEAMLQHLQQLHYQELHIVFGTVKDKDTDAVLKLLPAAANYYFSAAHIPRALSPTDLQAKSLQHGLKGNAFEDVNDAIKDAIGKAGKNDIIVVCGSIFLVAEVDREAIKGIKET
jgi:dihydrofolate synthase/folylpolyglutamate synthase